MAQVTLNVYDLTNGMARQLSPMLIGKQIDGIWHTSLVVFNHEYFFGGGICIEYPLSTMYGTPVQQIPMGTTSKTAEEFHNYLIDLSPKYTMNSYNLISHNCNHFTDEVSL